MDSDLAFCIVVALIFTIVAIILHDNHNPVAMIVIFAFYLFIIYISMLISRSILGYECGSIYSYLLGFVLFIIILIILGILCWNKC